MGTSSETSSEIKACLYDFEEARKAWNGHAPVLKVHIPMQKLMDQVVQYAMNAVILFLPGKMPTAKDVGQWVDCLLERQVVYGVYFGARGFYEVLLADIENQNQNQNQRSSSNRARPSAGLVPDILGSADANASSELCRAWGQVRDQQSLVFFDPRATANFITPKLAQKMGIKTNELGPAYTASMAAPGHEVAVTPLIGKLRLHIQGYVGHEEFYIMPLEGCDVLLGMPWFYNHKAVLDSFNKTVTLENRGRKIVLDVKLKGESVPLVSASAVPRSMKQHISASLIYVKERDETESSNLFSLDVSRRAFLEEYADCFSEVLPGKLPPERPRITT
ncbi:hypothetical protein L7F22_012498 [Adiantum nelumboides]|nr:hypothetical protein [Adiantum nelumboides]